MLQPKVSVVVPIYKVENYIHRCVDSIINQTYSNLEIILVNDGSPDKCGVIAERYQQKDSRVNVLHKQNGGLSDARNFGMELVTGELTMFVDSDDWLDLSMIELMVKNMKTYQADVVQSAFYYAYEDKLYYDHRYYDERTSPTIFDKKTVMYELVINEKVKNFAWGKLYKTDLIKEIPFKKGVLFEDVFWAHHVMHRVNRFVLIHQPLYYYRQREDSIIATYTPRNLDIIQGLKDRHQFIEKHYKELTIESYKSILKMSLIHYNLLLQNRKKDVKGQYRKEIENYIHVYKRSLRQAAEQDKQLQKQLTLFTIHPILNVMYLVILKGLRKINLLSKQTGLKRA